MERRAGVGAAVAGHTALIQLHALAMVYGSSMMTTAPPQEFAGQLLFDDATLRSSVACLRELEFLRVPALLGGPAFSLTRFSRLRRLNLVQPLQSHIPSFAGHSWQLGEDMQQRLIDAPQQALSKT